MKKIIKIPILKLLCFIGSLIAPFFERPLQKERISKILVFQGGGIGDVIRIFPAIQSLHNAIPNASFVILTQFGHNLFCLFTSPEIISEHVIYDLSGSHKSFLQKILLILSLRGKKFDLIFSPNHGLGMIEAMIITFLIGAPYRIGFDKGGAGFLYTTKKKLVNDKSIIEQHLDLLSQSGLTIKRDEPYLRIPEEDIVFALSSIKTHCNNISNDNLVITIAPDVKADVEFKSLPEYRSWPLERYVDLIEEITCNSKIRVIVLGRKPQDLHDAQSIKLLTEKNRNVINFMGRTSIAQAAALISISDLFIGNDSGLLHIAVALKKRCIAIFGATSPTQVIPISDNCIPIWKNLDCSPCFSYEPFFRQKCPHHIKCLYSVKTTDVIKAIEQIFHLKPL